MTAHISIDEVNKHLRNETPEAIIRWAAGIAERPVVTTNFRPLEAAILHAVTQVHARIPVIWCDTGYNTSYTYRHAERTIRQLKLNVDVFIPRQTAAQRDALMGIPEVDTPEHDEFTLQVKLEPFERAMAKYTPDVWFTNLRKDQTTFRSGLDIVSVTQEGVLRICPFFYFSDTELEAYLHIHGLESEDKYYDPTKALANRECGLHR